MIESFLNGLLERFDEEYLAKVQDDYHLSEIIENYKTRGFLKCKIDLEKYDSSFFTTVIQGKEGTRKIKSLTDADFLYDSITNGVYSLKVTGLWRKEQNRENRTFVTDSGISIKVLSVLVKSYTTNEDENENILENELLEQLQEDAINMDDDED